MKVWDLPTRIYHWSQLALVCGLFFSGLTEQGPHTKFGLALFTLLLWRLLWGLTGSDTSRFSHFIKSPFAVIRYLKGSLEENPGHNPAGGYMVIVLITALILQCLTGLAVAGYLDPLPASEAWLNDEVFDLAVLVHETGIVYLPILIALHISAILIYQLRGKPLVKAMFTGEQTISGEQAISGNKVHFAGNSKALLFFLLCLAVTVSLYLLSAE
ncbi:cytochrome b/b6 domain-containing protein [Vibrio sp. SCSIO 43137]|uniref:cytochrome b/b6 domain-containing protein n=1 Tax=Vibrio sp. SCSIO 43137 TaxID=3021011 RepID=UPI002307D6B5|nr:cytochrome b/b6 domain-containing protein [Vibrio sp. SCSIO 43137]WCE28662.1 cytochrome b/b6 domain-containing protein [Vibrio sp. SCSIO 43137]